MSTEIETKSAVPAGATHVCTVKGCGQHWKWKADGTLEPLGEIPCRHLLIVLEPIAEAGPAPTTAAPAERCESCGERYCKCSSWDVTRAPAEQLSGKVKTTFAWLAEHRPPGATREPCYGGEDANGVAFHTANHNAAAEAWITERIPREGFKAVEHGWFASPAEQPGKAADPRPARPQAPAEPTKEQIQKAGRVLAAVMDAERRGENMDPIIARALAEEAAPLREERDRLACELEAMRRERNGAQSQRDQERARAEQAEARLSAAPSEAPRHCRICEEPMSDTCEECQ